MLTRTVLFHARLVVGVVLLGGTLTLGLACGTPSHVTGQVVGLQSVTQISSRGNHTCALVSNHKVSCWGSNFSGELGNGKRKGSSTPVPVSGVTSATQVSSGGDHTCALLSDGTVSCWGDNYEGELGNGTTTNSLTPVPASGVTNATQVSSGGDHTCALLSDSTVSCWGNNYFGELGNGQLVDGGKTIGSSTPVPVKGITNATSVSAGDAHTCALLSNHGVECWGGNGYGQLGNGKTTDSSIPVPVKEITNGTSVSSGDFHACALLANHRVSCWGDNSNGQLGNGMMKSSSTPVPVLGVTNAIQVSSGDWDTCALLSNHRVSCWGDNSYGQLGNGKTTDSSTPVPVSAATNVIRVSGGERHTCALLSNHGVFCWGDSEFGQFGNGTTGPGITTTTTAMTAPTTAPHKNRKIVFVKSGDLWTIDADGRNLTRLTKTSKGEESAPAWSPDGSTLAYVIDGSDIYVAGADGSGATDITAVSLAGTYDATYGNYCDSDPTWSPDGKLIAFSTVADDCTGAAGLLFKMAPSGENRKVIEADYDGLLGGDTDPAWSPDGRRIVFTRSDSLRMASGPYVNNLFTLDARTGKVLRQLTKSGDSTQAAWSPDGKRLVFASPHEKIAVMSPTAGNPKVLAPGSAPAWSPNGQLIVFVDARGIELIRPNGTGKHLLLRCSRCSAPDW
jgi:alpha-tubulin suppressor-like RCC1 family protein